ncbi:MAG: NmrA/HSCARG family protein [Desulfobacteraceae bacterium]|nr:NmrA/HSCARG family protein [Desulfobacteraceae bacterium]
MAPAKLILVTGATGRQGGAVVQALLKQGQRVRALTRNPSSHAGRRMAAQGVEVVAGDFTDHSSLVRAARCADAIFAMTTPYEQGVEEEISHGMALVNAAREAEVGHFVYSSVASANRATGIPHFDSKFEIEKHLMASGLPYTIVAPVFFMENILQPHSLKELAMGRLERPMPGDRALQQIAIADIGAFTAAVIARREDVFGYRFDIAGDELNGEEEAAILSKATGRDIHYKGVLPDALRPQNDEMAAMYEWFFHTGYAADIDRLRRDFPEVEWHDLESWALAQDWVVLEDVRSETFA